MRRALEVIRRFREIGKKIVLLRHL